MDRLFAASNVVQFCSIWLTHTHVQTVECVCRLASIIEHCRSQTFYKACFGSRIAKVIDRTCADPQDRQILKMFLGLL